MTRKQHLFALILLLTGATVLQGSSVLAEHLRGLVEQKTGIYKTHRAGSPDGLFHLPPARHVGSLVPPLLDYGAGQMTLSGNTRYFTSLPAFLKEMKAQAKKSAFQWRYQVGQREQAISLENVEIDEDRRPRPNP